MGVLTKKQMRFLVNNPYAFYDQAKYQDFIDLPDKVVAGVKINKEHPLAKGLVAFHLFNEGEKVRNREVL